MPTALDISDQSKTPIHVYSFGYLRPTQYTNTCLQLWVPLTNPRHQNMPTALVPPTNQRHQYMPTALGASDHLILPRGNMPELFSFRLLSNNQTNKTEHARSIFIPATFKQANYQREYDWRFYNFGYLQPIKATKKEYAYNRKNDARLQTSLDLLFYVFLIYR